ncbi:MAG: Zn-dependent oligopeptidase [Deltaproteobacteria bacterium]|nr:Zn-dependent oligopeptidase [Deltaproteobacteria bacterium]
MKQVLPGVVLVALSACSTQSAPTPAPAPSPQGGAVTKPETSAAALAYQKECEADLEDAKALFASLEKLGGDKTVATALEPLNALGIILDKGLNVSGLMREVHPDASLRAVAETCEQDFNKLSTELSLSRPVFDAISAIAPAKEDAVTTRYLVKLLRDFRRAGVDKDQTTRDKIRAINEEIVKLGQEFEKNIREDVRSIKLAAATELGGLPQDYIDGHKPGADGKITVTTDYPDYIPFMSYAKSDPLRLALYKEFRRRGYPKNIEVLNALLGKRYELSRLLGYDNWAAYITEDKMIRTDKAARTFIDKVANVALPRAKKDYDELLAELKKTLPGAKSVGDWQKTFIEEQLKRDKYKVDSQALRPYFPYDAVKQGILDISAKLFGLSYKRVELPVWDPSVEAYEVMVGDTLYGTFFLDMHPRQGKYKHAAAFPMRTGVAGKQTPVGALVCNFPGGDGTPGLMEHDDVETFFHEFGHLLHHILGGRQRWIGISGFNVEWDFVETPSQLLEEWAWDSAVLRTFAKDAGGEPIPEALVKKMRAARDFGKGLQARHQMFYAMLSLAYYDGDPAGKDTTAILKELQQKYSPFAYVDDTFMQYSFGHLNGYTAMYYTYMWSLVIAKDLFSVFQKQGLLNPDPATRYRQMVLEPGGSEDAAALVKKFLGRDYSFDAFAAWLNAG